MMNIIGYFHGVDPAACLVVDGEIVAYVEEERLIRFKHAWDIFPIRSIDFCLKKGGIKIEDVDRFAYGWDLPRYTNGEMRSFFDGVNKEHPPGPGTVSWQNWVINFFNEKSARERLRLNLVKFFGKAEAPNLISHPHHASHAASAYFTSPFDEALVFTIDGSGDTQCATLWKGEGDKLAMIHEITIPHSLGWFYAAITEFLGFKAYDGEYKVMGLAAYGRENLKFRKGLEKVVPQAKNGYDYAVDSKYIHNGPHTYSDRFTDNLVDILGIKPRQGEVPLEPIHEDLAFEVQRLLEERVLTLLAHFRDETGMKNLCIGGGVALNVKMNSRIHKSGLFDDIFIFPIPSDSGNGIGAALGAYHVLTKKRPGKLKHVYFGPEFDDDDIELQLKGCGLKYKRCDDIAQDTAGLIADGKVVAWFQGGLEGGPRALGARSILADPRDTASRDRVNSAIKFREYWRPFCPSILEERAERYMKRAVKAPYMILAFDATDEAKTECPAVVHVDNTLRAQTVGKEHNRRYYDLIAAFERKTGVGAVLNTSFNIKGEAIVASPRDALRTFWSTGIDALAIGSCLVTKPDNPMPLKPEEVIR
ncbi:MAG: nodulation protein [Deltaproteobacteria bacterium]|uniref:Nodulation protein n=1 Tax=Candidatus Zymogenus saltonus TaxID=2844893 RepID=A0A9D8KLX5_9DELT|nr:nodulation protein [Candidatus Zymogenus saltonus]